MYCTMHHLVHMLWAVFTGFFYKSLQHESRYDT
jgi:hypothetical protein